MPLVTGLQEDHLQVEIMTQSFDGSISVVFCMYNFCCIRLLYVYDMCFMGSFPSQTEYCGWNEDDSSEA